MIEARDVPDAGTVGDIYALRAFHLGAVGIITDGALRDTEAIAELGRPVYHRASHGSTWGRRHMPFSHDEPITCAGVFVEPGDVIVGDTDGAVVIPYAIAAEVAADAEAQEHREAFAIERVRAGNRPKESSSVRGASTRLRSMERLAMRHHTVARVSTTCRLTHHRWCAGAS